MLIKRFRQVAKSRTLNHFTRTESDDTKTAMKQWYALYVILYSYQDAHVKPLLLHWARHKMVTILHTVFSDTFFSLNIVVFLMFSQWSN